MQSESLTLCTVKVKQAKEVFPAGHMTAGVENKKGLKNMYFRCFGSLEAEWCLERGRFAAAAAKQHLQHISSKRSNSFWQMRFL